MIGRISRRTALAGAAAAFIAVERAGAQSTPFAAPDTPLGVQLTWALGLFTGKPTGATAAEINAHFSPSVLAQVPVATLIASLDQASEQLGPITPISFEPTPTATSAVVLVETKSGRLDMILQLSDAPESLITILTFKQPDAAATPPAGATPVAIPKTPVGGQLTWLLGLLDGSPVQLSAADLAAHFDPAFLKAIGETTVTNSFNSLSIGYGPFALVSFVSPPTDTSAAAIVVGKNGARYQVSIKVNATAPYLITGLLANAAPVTDAFKSWDDFQPAWAKLAPRSGFLVEEITQSGPKLVVSANSTDVFALGSEFKLYVLGALANAVASGSMKWDDKLAVVEAWKSLPSGDTQNQAAGTELTLQHYAEKMISISDNTAADHLIHHLGREQVEAAVTAMGTVDPAKNRPFLTTRELFALKLAAPTAMVDAYIAADEAGRRAMLDGIDALPLDISMASGWIKPRFIDEIEWFASPADIAAAHDWLRKKASQKGLSEISAILAINPGVPLDAATWPFVGFKGGSEPGVLTLSWRLQAKDGRQFIFSASLNNTTDVVNEDDAITAATEAINLLAKTA